MRRFRHDFVARPDDPRPGSVGGFLRLTVHHVSDTHVFNGHRFDDFELWRLVAWRSDFIGWRYGGARRIP